MLKGSTAIYYLFFLLVIQGSAYCQSGRTVDSQSGVEIIFITEPAMFPAYWRTLQMGATSLSTSEVPRSERIVKAALRKYPDQVLRQHLRKIYVLDNLSVSNTSVGGLYDDLTDIIYMTGHANISEEDVEQTVHHEFSSILLRDCMYGQNCQIKFDTTAWKLYNQPCCFYSGDGTTAVINNRASEVFDPAYNRVGFLNQYSMASYEEDFNEFAQNIFKADPNFWAITRKYRRLNKKLRMIINFYNSIDQQFTRKYFEQVSRR